MDAVKGSEPQRAVNHHILTSPLFFPLLFMSELPWRVFRFSPLITLFGEEAAVSGWTDGGVGLAPDSRPMWETARMTERFITTTWAQAISKPQMKFPADSDWSWSAVSLPPGTHGLRMWLDAITTINYEHVQFICIGWFLSLTVLRTKPVKYWTHTLS